jgi:hypothetical protein
MADDQLKHRPDGPVTALLRIGPPSLQIAGLEQLRPEKGKETTAIKPIASPEFGGGQFLNVGEEFLEKAIPGKTRRHVASGESRFVSVKTNRTSPLGKIGAGPADIALAEGTETIGRGHRAGT